MDVDHGEMERSVTKTLGPGVLRDGSTRVKGKGQGRTFRSTTKTHMVEVPTPEVPTPDWFLVDDNVTGA